MKVTVKKFSSVVGILAILFTSALLINCRGDDDDILPPAPGLSGKVVLGDVSGAIVFADHQTGAEANIKIDASEAATQTISAANGTFTLPTAPSYPFIVVSFVGTDSLTGNTAMVMTAPAGSSRVSPLTTLVVAEPAMAAVITALGIDYTADITQAVTPAAAFLVHSIQAVINSLTSTMDSSSGGGLQNSQFVALQRTAMVKIAAQLKGMTTAGITTPGTLTTALQTAVQNTLDDATLKSKITFTSAAPSAASIVPLALVNAVATAIGSTSTTGAVTEASLVSSADVTAINTATNSAVTVATPTMTVTAPGNTLPVISGTPTTTLVAGTAYSFKPTATDANGDILLFSIVNRPDWATFNLAAVQLTGPPPSASSYPGVAISVTDGPSVVSLPSFTITVTTPTGSTGGTGGTGSGL